MNKDVVVNILGVQPYSFTDEKTGREIKGCSVYFHEEKEQNNEFGVGFIPRKASLPLEMYANISKFNFPCKANPVMETQFTSRGAKTKITDFKPLKMA